MQDALARPPVFVEKGEKIVKGIGRVFGRATVNDDRQVGFCRERHLFDEDTLLQFGRRVVVVIVEPDLAPRNDVGMARKIAHFVAGGIVHKLRFMGVNAGGCEDLRDGLSGGTRLF